MTSASERRGNQVAFRKLKNEIDRIYPVGRFVAIAGGQVVADGADFAQVDASLKKSGNDSADVLVVQAGIAYPESAVIYL